MALSRNVFEIFDVKEYSDLEIRVRGRAGKSEPQSIISNCAKLMHLLIWQFSILSVNLKHIYRSFVSTDMQTRENSSLPVSLHFPLYFFVFLAFIFLYFVKKNGPATAGIGAAFFI